MRRQRRPGNRTDAGDDVHHAVGESGFGEQFDELQRRERGVLGRLQDDCVSRGQRGRKLPGCDQRWIVPRRDRGDNAQWLTHREAESPLWSEVRQRHARPDDFVGPTREVAKHRSRSGYVSDYGVMEQLSHLDCLERRQRMSVSLDEVGNAREDLAALGCRSPRPLAVLERGTCCRNGAVDIHRARRRHLGDDLLGRGVVRRIRSPLGRGL